MKLKVTKEILKLLIEETFEVNEENIFPSNFSGKVYFNNYSDYGHHMFRVNPQLIVTESSDNVFYIFTTLTQKMTKEIKKSFEEFCESIGREGF
ncbi:MAG: hypothetical protein WCG91_01150 [Candidatus Shapirobacteria bacterium]